MFENEDDLWDESRYSPKDLNEMFKKGLLTIKASGVGNVIKQLAAKATPVEIDDFDVKYIVANVMEKYKTLDGNYKFNYEVYCHVVQAIIAITVNKSLCSLSDKGLVDMCVDPDGRIGFKINQKGAQTVDDMLTQMCEQLRKYKGLGDEDTG